MEHSFDHQSVVLTVGFKERSPEPVLMKEGKVLGVLTQKESKQALSKAGLLVEGQQFPNAVVNSHVTTAIITVDPDTVVYPHSWTKLVSDADQCKTPSPFLRDSQMFRTKLTQLPPLLFVKEDYEWTTANGQVEERPALGLSVDARLIPATKEWLSAQGVQWQEAFDPNWVELERERGYEVVLMKLDLVPLSVLEPLLERCGELLQASGQPNTYLERIESLPKLPSFVVSKPERTMVKEVHNSVPSATSVVPLPPSYRTHLTSFGG